MSLMTIVTLSSCKSYEFDKLEHLSTCGNNFFIIGIKDNDTDKFY